MGGGRSSGMCRQHMDVPQGSFDGVEEASGAVQFAFLP